MGQEMVIIGPLGKESLKLNLGNYIDTCARKSPKLILLASAASYGVAGCPRMKKEGQTRGKVGSGRNSSLYLCLMVAQLCRQSKSTYVPN